MLAPPRVRQLPTLDGMGSVRLDELSVPLQAALEHMLTQPKRLRPWVRVEDTVTGRFVQFCGDNETALMIDLPDPQHGSDFSHVPKLRAPDGRSFYLDSIPNGFAWRQQWPEPRFEEIAALALTILRTVHRLPDEAALKLIVEPRPN